MRIFALEDKLNSPCPVGISDNSPAIHRWGSVDQGIISVPEGRQNLSIEMATIKYLSRPYGSKRCA